MSSHINKSTQELLRFLVAGVSAVATDTTVYFLLIQLVDKNISKGVSFVAGTVVAYFINKYWTFKKPQKSLQEVIKFATLYITILLVNILVNYGINLVFPNYLVLAFLGAKGTSTVLNFLCQKFWVFRGGNS